MIIPIAFFAMIAAIVLVPNYLRYLERGRMHETLRIAYEKGQPVPQEIIEALQSKDLPSTESTPERDLRRGLVLVAWGVGLALLGLGLWYGIDSNTIIGSDQDNASYIVGACTAGAGGIPGMIGVAYLILWWTKRNAPKA